MCTPSGFIQDKGDMPASLKVLMGASGLFGKGYEVHGDNWYTSPGLFHYFGVGVSVQLAQFMSVASTCQKTCRERPAVMYTITAWRWACCTFSVMTRCPSQCCRQFTIARLSQSQTNWCLLWFSTKMSRWRGWTWVTSWLIHNWPLASPTDGTLKFLLIQLSSILF